MNGEQKTAVNVTKRVTMTAVTWQSVMEQEVVEKERRLIRRFQSGECLYRQGRVLMLILPEGRRTLVTSYMNGGYQEGLQAVFNSQTIDGDHALVKIEDYSQFLRATAEQVGLDPERCAGLSTAARMDNAALVTKRFKATEVTAIVTAGIECNGGRAGDPAAYNEVRGVEFLGGTIVTMLLINGDLPRQTMARAIMTATEAKTCALQQLMAHSRYSTGIATGSGTDQIAIIADPGSSNRLTDAGKHSKLGELVGQCVIEATSQALDKQNGLNPLSQRNALVRLQRFRVTERDIWMSSQKFPGSCGEQDFLRSLSALAGRPDVVAATGSILHLMDEISWGLIPEDVGRRMGAALVKDLPRTLNAPEEGLPDLVVDEAVDPVPNLVDGLAQMAKYGRWCT